MDEYFRVLNYLLDNQEQFSYYLNEDDEYYKAHPEKKIQNNQKYQNNQNLLNNNKIKLYKE